MGVPGTRSARHRARLAYSAYLGWYDLADRAASARELAAYQRTVIEVITAQP